MVGIGLLAVWLAAIRSWPGPTLFLTTMAFPAVAIWRAALRRARRRHGETPGVLGQLLFLLSLYVGCVLVLPWVLGLLELILSILRGAMTEGDAS